MKAITFDFWGTLYHGGTGRDRRMQRLGEVLRSHGYLFEPERIEQANTAAWTEWERVWRQELRTLGSADWLRLMFADLDVQLPEPVLEALATTFAESILEADPPLRLVDGVGAALRRLSACYALGIICDTGLSDGRTLRRILERDGVLERFACLTFSDEIGVSKPHPTVFLRTLACLDARPEQAVHIGDLTRTDIQGARSVGMRAVKFIGVADDPDRTVLPDAIVSSFADFEQLIDAWDAGPVARQPAGYGFRS